MRCAPLAWASSTTALPTAPAAPDTITHSPGSRRARSSADQAVTKGTPTAAASSADKVCGRRVTAAAGTLMNSAWLPSRVKPMSPPEPQTGRPIMSACPSDTVPAKSRPTMRGSVVAGNLPFTFPTSLGLIPAASIRTRTSSPPSGVSSTSTYFRTSDGEPKLSI